MSPSQYFNHGLYSKPAENPQDKQEQWGTNLLKKTKENSNSDEMDPEEKLSMKSII